MILYICSSETDYGQDLLYAGLVRKLGRDQILDWPFNKYYYFEKGPYPRNMGHMGLQGITSHLLIRLSGKIPWERVKAVVVGACKKRVFESYLSLQSQIPSSVPVVFNDCGDYPEIGEHLKADQAYHLYEEAIRKRPFDLVLKREYLKERTYPKNIVPFPFCFNFEKMDYRDLQSIPKKYQVAFWAVESHPVRTQALQKIEDLFDCRENGTVRNQKFKTYKRKGSLYLQELKKVQVALNFRGAGWDTLRYWEIPAIGNLMVSEEPGIVIPDNFEDGKHVIFCRSDLSDLIEKCQWGLDHPDKAAEMGAKAREHAIRFHSHEVRAEQFLKHLSSL